MTEEILEETALAPSELIELFKHRSATYGLLSRLYAKEVDAELLDELHDTLWPVETGTDAGDEGNRLIATYLSGIWENTLTELAADYMRTFFGHGYSGHAAAYPFESVYSSEKRLLMQSARDEVLALYRAASPLFAAIQNAELEGGRGPHCAGARVPADSLRPHRRGALPGRYRCGRVMGTRAIQLPRRALGQLGAAAHRRGEEVCQDRFLPGTRLPHGGLFRDRPRGAGRAARGGLAFGPVASVAPAL